MDILQNFSIIEKRLFFQEAERPIVFQIFDNDPIRITNAANLLFPLNPDILDINLGCSARKVSNRGAGVGLLRNPGLVKQILAAVIKISPIPVTVKIRLGWDDSTRNYLEIARIVEGEGAALIAVHGRTRKQAYTGKSDWEAIAELKNTVKIPVIANGDVKTLDDIDKIKSITGCDGVMIGRGSIGNPWIFSRMDRRNLHQEKIKQVVLEHLQLMLYFYGDHWGLLRFRKHLKAYFSPFSLPADDLSKLLTTRTVADLKIIITSLDFASSY